MSTWKPLKRKGTDIPSTEVQPKKNKEIENDVSILPSCTDTKPTHSSLQRVEALSRQIREKIANQTKNIAELQEKAAALRATAKASKERWQTHTRRALLREAAAVDAEIASLQTHTDVFLLESHTATARKHLEHATEDMRAGPSFADGAFLKQKTRRPVTSANDWIGRHDHPPVTGEGRRRRTPVVSRRYVNFATPDASSGTASSTGSSTSKIDSTSKIGSTGNTGSSLTCTPNADLFGSGNTVPAGRVLAEAVERDFMRECGVVETSSQLYCIRDDVCVCGATTQKDDASFTNVCPSCFREQTVSESDNATLQGNAQTKSDWSRRRSYFLDHLSRMLGPALSAEQHDMLDAMFSALNSMFADLKQSGCVERLNMYPYRRTIYKFLGMLQWGGEFQKRIPEPPFSHKQEESWKQICSRIPSFVYFPPTNQPPKNRIKKQPQTSKLKQ